MKYRVQVLLADGIWSASVVDADGAHTYSQTLLGLEHEVREAICAAEELPEDAEFELEYDWANSDEHMRAVVRDVESRAR
jgi:hypothetical protein